MWLCGTCHRDVHRNPFESRGTGFIVSRTEENPGSVPLHAWYGVVLLDCHGFFTHFSSDSEPEENQDEASDERG